MRDDLRNDDGPAEETGPSHSTTGQQASTSDSNTPTGDAQDQRPLWYQAVRRQEGLEARLRAMAKLKWKTLPIRERQDAERELAKEHGVTLQVLRDDFRRYRDQYMSQEERERQAAIDVSLGNPVVIEATERGERKVLPLVGWPVARVVGQNVVIVAHAQNIAHMLKAYQYDVWWDPIRKRLGWSWGGTVCEHFDGDNELNAKVRQLADLNAMRLPTHFDALLNTVVFKNERNEVVRYLQSLRWDGVPRFRKLLDALDADSDALNEAVLRCLLVGACAAGDHAKTARTKGARGARGEEAKPVFEYVTLFAGPQGLGKTKGLEDLLPRPLRQFFGSGVMLDLAGTGGGKDTALLATSYWVCELGELGATFRRTDIERLKSFLSQDTDRIRKPYGKSATDFPRTTLFVATVNSDTPLVDRTGNRRFLPLRVGRFAHGWSDEDVDQLWAEAWHRYAVLLEQWWPTPSEEAQLREQQDELTTDDLVTERLREHFDWERAATDPTARSPDRATTTQLLRLLGLQARPAEVATALTRLWSQHGGKRVRGELKVAMGDGQWVRARSPAGRHRGWVMPPLREGEY